MMMQFNPSVLEDLHNYQQVKNHRLHLIYHPHSYDLNKADQLIQQTKQQLQSLNNYDSLQDVYYKQYLLAMHAKEYITLKQKKASQLKNHSIFEKSKRVEASLSRWNQKIVKKKVQSISKKDLSPQKQMLNINNKNILKSSLSSKKREHLQKYQVNLTNQQRSIILQPEIKNILKKYQSINYRKLKNKTINLLKSQSIEYSDLLQEKASLQIRDQDPQTKISVKNDRINEARYMKYYIQQQKIKQFITKESSFKKLQRQNLSQIKNQLKCANQVIEAKYREGQGKSKKKLSLPYIKAALLHKNMNQAHQINIKFKTNKKQQLGAVIKKTLRHRQKSMFQILKEESSLYD